MKPKVDQPENPLFTNGENSNMNACVGDNGGPYDLFQYGRGFFAAGHSIVSTAEQHLEPVDLLIYPAAFSYRHAIELFLKHLIKKLFVVNGEEGTFKKLHGMMSLWNKVIDLNRKLDPPIIEAKAVKRAGEIIGHFDSFDPTGQVFRYPEDINENQHLAEHKLINVQVLRDYMRELQEILERWVYEVEGVRDYQRDAHAEHYAEMARGGD